MTVKFNRKAYRNPQLVNRKRLHKAIADVLNEEAEEAVSVMKEHIETTPSGIRDDKDNRVLTGHMRDSVSRTGLVQNGGKFSVRVGWTDTKEDYFAAQEYGTGTKQGGSFANISPMAMLWTYGVGARERLLVGFRNVLRNMR